MSRRRAATKREILPDPKFRSETLARFINNLMERGKKSVAEKIVYGALDVVAKQSKTIAKSSDKVKTDEEDGGSKGAKQSKATVDPLMVFQQVLDSVRPSVEVRSRRVGGATYQVPVEIRESRSIALAMRWLIDAARQRSEKGMITRLANEILDALQGKGNALKKREDTHRMAKANQAFAHFRW